MLARIFLCHSSEDKPKVREIFDRLSNIEGFEPWIDEKGLLPGQIWKREIPRIIKDSDFILIFLSRNSVTKRGYIQREMKMILDAWEEIPEGTIHTIPVRLDDSEVPETLQHYHYANLWEPDGFDRLIMAIRLGLDQRQDPLIENIPSPLPISNNSRKIYKYFYIAFIIIALFSVIFFSKKLIYEDDDPNRKSDKTSKSAGHTINVTDVKVYKIDNINELKSINFKSGSFKMLIGEGGRLISVKDFIYSIRDDILGFVENFGKRENIAIIIKGNASGAPLSRKEHAYFKDEKCYIWSKNTLTPHHFYVSGTNYENSILPQLRAFQVARFIKESLRSDMPRVSERVFALCNDPTDSSEEDKLESRSVEIYFLVKS